MNFRDLVKERAAIRSDIERQKAEHGASIKRLEARLKELADAELLLLGGIDVDRRERGLRVISVNGSVATIQHGWYSDQNRSGVRVSAVNDAKLDVANGAVRLRREYIGVKNYAHFGDQREDHSYGMGPRHGSIVFSIRLRDDVRKRLRDGGSLTEQEIEDALYVLSTLDKAEELRASA